MTEETKKNSMKEQLKNYVESITSVTSKNQYICPLCGSGTHSRKTAAFTLYEDTNSFYCFACDANGDIFDLVAAVEHLELGSREVFLRTAEILNIDVDVAPKIKIEPAMKCPEALEYLTQTRGLSIDIVERFNLGYDPCFSFIGRSGKETTNLGPAIVIPTSTDGEHYITRLLNKPDWYNNSYIKPTGISDQIFNESVLIEDNPDPVFVTEGPFDALAIIEAGADAVATNGIGGKNRLIRTHTKRPLIISYDNDAAGQKASNELAEDLDANGLRYMIINISGDDVKDPGESLVKDKAAFTARVKNALLLFEDEYILRNRVSNYLPTLIADIESGKGEQPIKTHFSRLDEALSGGLYASLYCIGAIPSIGKTSFILQIADNIAKGGSDVLIFTLEMAKRELIAKSVSREFSLLSGKKGMSTRRILSGLYPDQVKPDLLLAVENYQKYADRIFIVEGIGCVGTKEIKEGIMQHIRATGCKPVVFIDYLQLLQPSNERQSDKQNMDTSIMELKRISRDIAIPVVVISSFNRQNYTKSANMASVKESGSIEYSCDFLGALQYKNTDECEDSLKLQMSKSERDIEMLILKNRNGVGFTSINYTFYALDNKFEEV